MWVHIYVCFLLGQKDVGRGWGQRVLICKTKEFGPYLLCNWKLMENFKQGSYSGKFIY